MPDNPLGSHYNPATIQLYPSRRFVDPFNLTEDDIDIQDIIHALSMKCRYGGHTPKFYSVAQHSVEVSLWLTGESLVTQLAGLLHDAPEAYLPDLLRPIKHHHYCKGLVETDIYIDKLIMLKFLSPWIGDLGLDVEWDVVKLADDDILRSEAISVIGSDPTSRGLKHPSVYRPVNPLPPREAKLLFEDRYLFLMKGLETQKEAANGR